MGGVWCKTDKGHSRSYTKGPINAHITRWTDQIRQAYRKPKTYRRPARPPQKPIRSNDRLTISHPQLVKEASSDGWRTATLMVPEAAPVPPPRKKRKRNKDLTRTAFSMDDLNRVETLNTSTISLPDKYHSDTGLDSRSSSSTLVVTPILESRLDHSTNKAEDTQEDNKENIKTTIENKIEEEDEDEVYIEDHADEIVPIEKDTIFSTRTLLHSNLGYIDKLSAISEVSTESGFDDRTDVLKSSERSESVTSSESLPRESGLNILAHIHNINNVSHLNEVNKDLREKTAVSKKQWLQNILKEEPEPYFISRDLRRASDSITLGAESQDIPGQPNSLPTDHLHLMNRETETSAADSSVPPPSADTNHSVLLELLQKNNDSEDKFVTAKPFVHKEESIFLTNTKTNIIYKSLSSDNLTNDYDTDYLDATRNDISSCNTNLTNGKEDNSKSESITQKNCAQECSNPFNGLTSKSHLSDFSFQTPKLVESDTGLNNLLEEKRSNIVSSFDFKEIKTGPNYVTALKDLKLSGDVNPHVLVNGDSSNSKTITGSEKTKTAENKNKEHSLKESLTNKDSESSSRRSSISDSLHEFEMSIYDMLKESKKNRDSSDEDDSLKTVKVETRQ